MRRKSNTADGARLLIGTKLGVPKPRAGLVARPPLIDMLDRGRDRRVTLVSAPAGYGKTTLVAQWLHRDASPPAAWLSLDPLDNDLGRFTRYVVAALHRVEKDCLSETEKLLSARNLPSPKYLAESMVLELEKLGRLVLVLDDYGFIRAPVVHELMDSLVPKLPSTLHLVVMSRIDPPLPLSLWRGRHWLHELRATDLRFSREETGAFFAAANALGLSDEGIATLHHKTEGWITGLRLALLSLAGTADPEGRVKAFSTSDRLVTDYLMEEVLARQPSEITEFLAGTSVLERFSPQLCDELLAGCNSEWSGRSQELLDRLYEQNLFLVSLGPTHGWYRYHHLFRELLLERFDELAVGMTQADILKRAGEWFCEQGWTEDGLKCFLAAHDLDAATDVIADHLDKVIIDDWSRRTLARWLEMFPSGAERTRLPLLIGASYIRTFRTDYEGVDRLLDEIDAACRDATGELQQRWRQAFQMDLGFLRAFAAFWRGDIERAYEQGGRVLGQTSGPQSFLAMATIMYYGASLALTGRQAEYIRFIEGGTTGPGFSESPQQLPYRVVEAVVHLYRGELAECRGAAAHLTTSTHFAIPKYFDAIGYFLLGVVAYERNTLDEAERYFLAVESRRFDTAGFIYHGAAVGLAQTAMARGDIGAAERHAAAARAFALQSENAMLVRASEAFEDHLAVAAGRPGEATTGPPSGPDFMQLPITAPSYSRAWVHIHSPSFETRQGALDLVDDALHHAEAHGVTRRVIQLSGLRALALDAQNRRDEALAGLDAALRRGAALGFVRSFADCGERLCPLLKGVLERRADDAQALRVLDAIGTSLQALHRRVPHPARAVRSTPSLAAETDRSRATPADGGAPPVDSLTNRELDVLELLQRRLSNKEIAEQLAVSAATVKMHTLNIYRKLGVPGRRQAVACAIERGILSG